MNTDLLILYGQPFSSRLLLGTAQYPSLAVLQDTITIAKPAMITVALRRMQANDQENHSSFFDVLKALNIPLLPNTAGCYEENTAFTTAQMGRELFNTEWVKLELIGDPYTLQPDMSKLIPTAKRLIDEGFKVLPYCTDDLIACQRLLDVGCEVLMPWAAPIGSGQGAINPFALKTLRARLAKTPLIIDAGLGLPSHAATVMEWGFDGVLINSAVSGSGDPISMANAFAMTTQAGRFAYRAKPMPARDLAMPSTPVIGTPFWHQ